MAALDWQATDAAPFCKAAFTASSNRWRLGSTPSSKPGYQPQRKRPASPDGLAKNVRLGADGKFHWHWDPRFRTGARDLNQRTMRLQACASNLELPTLLVRGGLSDLLSEAGAQAFLKLCPNAEYVSVTGAGHMVAGDRNDIFGTAVIEFLGRAVPAGGQPLMPPGQIRSPADQSGGDFVDVP